MCARRLSRGEDWGQDALGAAVTYLMRWDADNSLGLLSEWLPSHDRFGGAMIYYILTAAHPPVPGLRAAFRQEVTIAPSSAAKSCAYALSQIGEPEDRDFLRDRLDRLRERRKDGFSSEDGRFEGELVTAIMAGRAWSSTKEEETALRASCLSDECKHRFRSK